MPTSGPWKTAHARELREFGDRVFAPRRRGVSQRSEESRREAASGRSLEERLVLERVRKLRIERRRSEGLLVSTEAVAARLSQLWAGVAARLLQLPREIAGRSSDPRVEGMLDESIREILNEIADTVAGTVRRAVTDDRRSVAEDAEAPAETDGLQVG